MMTDDDAVVQIGREKTPDLFLRGLAINVERSGKPALFMTVRREITQSRCETGARSRENPRRT